MKSKISDIFKDKNGKYSGTSIAKLFIVFAIIGVWLYVSVKTSTISAIPESLVMLVCGSLGVGVFNKFADNKKEDKQKSVCPTCGKEY